MSALQWLQEFSDRNNHPVVSTSTGTEVICAFRVFQADYIAHPVAQIYTVVQADGKPYTLEYQSIVDTTFLCRRYYKDGLFRSLEFSLAKLKRDILLALDKAEREKVLDVVPLETDKEAPDEISWGVPRPTQFKEIWLTGVKVRK